MRVPAIIAVAVIMGSLVGCGADDGSPENIKWANSPKNIKQANSAASLAGGVGVESCTSSDGDVYGGTYDCGSVTCYVTRGRISPDGNRTSDYYDCIWKENPDSATGPAKWVCVVDTGGDLTVKDAANSSCVP